MPADTARAREHLERQRALIARLRGTGPNPFEYDQWDARTAELLAAIFGAESEELQRYRDEVDTRGRLPGVRGSAENMTLNIHGKWGIRGRLDRAESVLDDLIRSLAQPGDGF